MAKKIAKVWTFSSSSDPDKTYETLRYTDGTTSCNCPGWTRRTASDGTRSCKHTRLVDQGRADMDCLSSHNYEDSFESVKEVQVETVVEVTRIAQPRRRVICNLKPKRK